MIKSLQELEQSTSRPIVADLPRTRWRNWQKLPTDKDLYDPAFAIEDIAEAEQYFRELLAWRVRRDFSRGVWRTWAQLVATEREAMAWYALAIDASAVNCVKGIPPTLAKIARLYGAFLPERCRIGKTPLLPEAMALQESAEIAGHKVSDIEANAAARKAGARKQYDWARNQISLFQQQEAA